MSARIEIEPVARGQVNSLRGLISFIVRARIDDGIDRRWIIRSASEILEAKRARCRSNQPVQQGRARIEGHEAGIGRIAKHPEDRCDRSGSSEERRGGKEGCSTFRSG